MIENVKFKKFKPAAIIIIIIISKEAKWNEKMKDWSKINLFGAFWQDDQILSINCPIKIPYLLENMF